ncbi:MAG: protein kinase [Deltaproteobacteria bacterium]|nr:protein kinase [Deltaproteobacteria bacterium]
MVTPGLPMPAPAAAARPLRLGKYQILRQLATGGMAEIYLARHMGIEGFEKLVVIKRILPVLAADPHVVQMFLDEARLAATLHHSNIVQVFDIECDAGSYFLAMEFLHGEDVGRVMKALRASGRELPLEHAVSIVLGVCAGLHYAHERTGSDGQPLEIVHRDVTPQNVFVTYEGAVKLVDFGIAKASRRATATRYGTLKGKIRYMSPEQARCLPLDRRSDVFAVGILLWELTTGRRLFGGPSEFDTLRTIIETDAPPPSGVTPGYPHRLEQIVLHALRRPKEERYQTAQEMQLALEEFAFEHQLRVSPVALAGFMGGLFEGKIAAWREAQRLGTSFADHIVGSIVREGDDLPWLDGTDPAGGDAVASEYSWSGSVVSSVDGPPPPRRLAREPTVAGVATTPGRRPARLRPATLALVIIGMAVLGGSAAWVALPQRSTATHGLGAEVVSRTPPSEPPHAGSAPASMPARTPSASAVALEREPQRETLSAPAGVERRRAGARRPARPAASPVPPPASSPPAAGGDLDSMFPRPPGR